MTTVPTTQGEKVVVVEPGARVQGEVRHTVTGKVEGIDRNAGQITIDKTKKFHYEKGEWEDKESYIDLG